MGRLVVKRRVGERVMIDDDIVITLVEIEGRSARIGIEASQDHVIFREEIYLQIQKDKNETEPPTS